MQIIRANNLHVEEEVWEEVVRGHQEERGIKNIIKIGDHVKCPACSSMGSVVWVSKDRKTAGIQCPASHQLLNRPASRLGSEARPQSKTSRNMVFMTEIK